MKFIKIKHTVLIICLFIFCTLLFGVAYADSPDNYDEYIVKLKNVNDITLSFYNTTDSRENYVLMSGKELKQAYNNNIVEYAEPNYIITLSDFPDDKYYPKQWGIQKTQFEFAWKTNNFGDNIRVGVIDSGIADYTDDLLNIKSGYNCINNNTNTDDTYWHGTFVASIIGSALNNSIGLAGASRADLIPIKIFDDKTSYISYAIEGIYRAVDDFNCDIINMSFALDNGVSSRALSTALKYAEEHGVIAVAATGNTTSGNTTAQNCYPAAQETVIGVGATTSSDTLASFSNFGNMVMVTAPGYSVHGIRINPTNKTFSYSISSGTSFAAPLVSAAAAIVKGRYPQITPKEFRELLISSADDLGDVGYDIKFGYGRLNVRNLMIYSDIYFSVPSIDNNNIKVSGLTYYNNAVHIDLYNTSDEIQSGYLITALYNYNNELINYDTEQVLISSTELYSTDKSIKIDDNSYVRIFFFNNLNQIMPLMESCQINE